jgi:hypothetical protein
MDHGIDVKLIPKGVFETVEVLRQSGHDTWVVGPKP